MKTLLAEQIRDLIHAVHVTAGYEKAESAPGPFQGYEPIDMFRFFFTESGVPDAATMNKDRLAMLTIDTLRSPALASVNTNDLSQLIQGTVTTGLLKGVGSAATSFQFISAPGSVTDLSRSTLILNSECQDITPVAEGAAPNQGALADVATPVSLTKWGQCIQLTTESIARNSLDLLTVIPFGLGKAMARKMNFETWKLLLTNNGPVMAETGTTLWSAAHGNLQAGALTEANFASALQALTSQKLRAPGAAVFDCLRPRSLIVGPRDYLTACKLVGTTYTDTRWAPMQVICEPLIPALSGANPWFIASDPMQLAGSTIVTLKNRRDPSVIVQSGGVGGAKGICVDMSHFWQVLALDHRCFVKSVA